MLGIILYFVVAAAVLFLGYKAYRTNESTDKDKVKYVVFALLIIALFWPIFVLALILIYVIYKKKIWKNVKDFKNKLDKW